MNTNVTEFRRTALVAQIDRVLQHTPVIDIHTHLYDPYFGSLLLWGIDDLLIYHYLVSEAFRYRNEPYADFWSWPKNLQAEWIWNALFTDHTPVSESCRGVLTTLHRFGLDVNRRDLDAIRDWYAGWPASTHVSRCMELANVKAIYMTNSPFEPEESRHWQTGFPRDERFLSALRVDPLLVSWPDVVQRLIQWGYNVGEGISSTTVSEVRRFLADWTRRIDAHYLMVSLPPDFQFPGNSDCAELLEKAVLPHCADYNLPMALMLGVKRAVNPELKLAGDGVGRSDLEALRNLCEGFPKNKFMATVLSRENQHELCVLARKFRNLHPFGCWWFSNIPKLIEETTAMRVELLGTSFTAQHSDARVVDQIIYKWDHTRRILGKVLAEKYGDLAMTGWEPTAAEIERDVRDLLGGSFETFRMA